MERLTTRHCGVAVIKDKSLLKEAMEKLAKYEEMESMLAMEYFELQKKFEQIDRKASDELNKHTEEALDKVKGKERYEAWGILREQGIYMDPDDIPGVFDICNDGCFREENKNEMTNADRIRAMSDEELADWIHNMDHHYGDDNEPMVGVCDLDTNELTEIYDSFGDLLEWLQEKRSVDGDDE